MKDKRIYSESAKEARFMGASLSSCCFLIVLMNIALGGWSVDFILKLFGTNIAFIGDALIGLILGQFTVPIAATIWLLDVFGAITL